METVPVAPEPTTALINTDDIVVNEVAGTPPKLTFVAPDKFVPFIEIVVPVPPVVGENEVIVCMGI